jgi:hypothetical protein
VAGCWLPWPGRYGYPGVVAVLSKPLAEVPQAGPGGLVADQFVQGQGGEARLGGVGVGAAGHLRGEQLPDPHGRTLITLRAIAADIGLALGDEETAVIQQADAGVAAAQQELALIFLPAGRPDRARPWLDLAAEQGCADALFCLGEARIAAPMTDPTEGLALIRRATVAGHPLALAVMEGLRARRGP